MTELKFYNDSIWINGIDEAGNSISHMCFCSDDSDDRYLDVCCFERVNKVKAYNSYSPENSIKGLYSKKIRIITLDEDWEKREMSEIRNKDFAVFLLEGLVDKGRRKGFAYNPYYKTPLTSIRGKSINRLTGLDPVTICYRKLKNGCYTSNAIILSVNFFYEYSIYMYNKFYSSRLRFQDMIIDCLCGSHPHVFRKSYGKEYIVISKEVASSFITRVRLEKKEKEMLYKSSNY